MAQIWRKLAPFPRHFHCAIIFYWRGLKKVAHIAVALKLDPKLDIGFGCLI